MSDSSCDCHQVYNLPLEEEEEPKKEEEEVEVESTKESSSSWAAGCILPTLRDFFLGAEDVDKLSFNELLFIRNRLDGKVVGKIVVYVEQHSKEYFTVGCHGELPVGGSIHTTDSIGRVKIDFDLIDEIKKEEHVEVEPLVESLLTKREGEGYVVTETRERSGQEYRRTRTRLGWEEFRGVLSPSAAVLLLRQLARKDFVGKKHLLYLHLNAEICQQEFKCYPFDIVQINNGFCRAKRIRRRVVMPNKEVTEVNSYYSEAGRLLLLCWPGEVFYASVDRRAVLDIGPKEGVPKDPVETVPLRERLKEHPILSTVLEEERGAMIREAGRYLEDHQEVRDVLSFLAKTLLLYKPHKVVHFLRTNIAPYL